MQIFEVWAPEAESVSVSWDEPGWSFAEQPESVSTAPLHPVDGGWWQAKVLTSRSVVDYGFSVNGGPLRPDPRSTRQPFGVHEVSRTSELEPLAVGGVADQQWAGCAVRGAVLYELHVGTFTPEGTFDAAIGLLPYLVDLGVTMIQLMPVAAFNGTHGWGYDAVSWYAVHEPYGGPAGLQRFVTAAHRAGLGVSLDVVYNHLGPSGNYLAEFGPYFSTTHSTDWGPALHYDGPNSAPVREYMLSNALQWFTDFGVDALRLDAIHAIADDSEVHVLHELSARVAELAADYGRPMGLIAETNLNQPSTVASLSDGGLGMTAQWNDDLHHALHALTAEEDHAYYADFGSVETLAHVLTDVFWLAGRWSEHRQEPWGAPVDPDCTDGLAFLGYSLTHDQVGNRALGDRPSSYLTSGQLALRAAVVALGPFTPMLFMGEEWGALTPWQYFVDHAEPALAAAVKRGRRREFAAHGWSPRQVADPTDPATFHRSTLRWDVSREFCQIQLWQWYQQLFALRKAHPELASGDLTQTHTIFDEAEQWLVLLRGSWVVVLNFSSTDQVVPLPAGAWVPECAFDQAELQLTADGPVVAVGTHSCFVARDVL